MVVKFTDLHDAFLFVDVDGGMSGNEAFLCLETGKIYLHSEIADADELPDDIENDGKYLPIPNKRQLELDTRLVFGFTRKFLPADAEEIEDFFRRKGGYAKFKRLLDDRRALDQWRAFETQAEEAALRAWCLEHSIDVID